MPSTRSKKARARRSRESDIMSDLENMDILLGSDQFNQMERDLEQMTSFSNDLKGTKTEKIRLLEKLLPKKMK